MLRNCWLLLVACSCVASTFAQTTATAPAQTSAPARPQFTAIRVPDGAMNIDGRFDDWARMGSQTFNRCRTAPDTARLWSLADESRGKYMGDRDCGVVLFFAHDSINLYILAFVQDQFLTNTAGEHNPHEGDDFELFIDANAADHRFADKVNENVRQYILVPANVNLKWSEPYIWTSNKQADKPKVATRLLPFGYAIEIAIPKASFPYWKEHPELDAIGFDGMITDADAPGIDIHHPAMKGALYFGTAERHVTSPKHLSLLKLEAEPVTLTAAKPTTMPTAKEMLDQLAAKTRGSAVMLVAMRVLDMIDDAKAADVASAAIGHESTQVQKAGLQILAQRPKLDAPVEKIVDVVKTMAVKEDLDSQSAAQYGLVALAVRKKMPVADLKDACLKTNDPALVLTYAWCCGINGDKAATPILADLLKNNKNPRVQMMAALAMGLLQDKAAIEPLTQAKSDPNGDVQRQVKDSLKKLGAP